MTDADTLLREGDLDGARQALVGIVRTQPSNQQARMFLFQLLAIAGEWDKAHSQLQALAQLSAEAQMLAVAYGQAIAAEKQRAAIFAGAAPMPLLRGEGTWAQDLAQSITALAKGDIAQADDLRLAAFDAAPDNPGGCNGDRFDWIADADTRFGPAIEIIMGGRYGLIGFDQIAAIRSKGPRDLRDTVWYPVEVFMRQGQSAAAMLPARYPGSETADSALRLARSTDWIECDWGQQGLGQHVWTVSGGADCGILEIRDLVFD
ncbi:type VI secretion system accessory protein TagJ [Novosphingobium sp.]|uniref:type VI secretion system accessory protein TagJ n=1 Tax=Novosphingobium sp. TaxID=1874826 RepID=UPI003B518549